MIVFGFVALQSPASEPKTPIMEKKSEVAKASTPALPFDRDAVARVEAIRFKLPETTLKNGEKVEMEDFSFLNGGHKVDLSRLEELSVKKAELTPTQIETLIQAIYGKNKKMPSAACYSPHHLFLFYDASGKLINSVELCFSCTGVVTSPELPEKHWYRHDFRKLAKLCEECGIGLHATTLKQFNKVMGTREAN
ncbi:hypothetical protein DES53_10233 [Roseimicrobium gellanilyticum]|uniref:Uncharacterized protein n=2 Tax=Roseimicrobium gellanilyticum TaxID=748857 RepID=A0A366HPT3_9BACT|nr:hypothetical protein DES53_10233 [Roseimicrobium gellanilyticum]